MILCLAPPNRVYGVRALCFGSFVACPPHPCVKYEKKIESEGIVSVGGVGGLIFRECWEGVVCR